jgi:hypothetical protein
MELLNGLHDRSLILEDSGFLSVRRWGDDVSRIAVADLGETEIVRDDKKHMFGKTEELIRLRFGAIVTAIWIEADREQEVKDFADAVDAARP